MNSTADSVGREIQNGANVSVETDFAAQGFHREQRSVARAAPQPSGDVVERLQSAATAVKTASGHGLMHREEFGAPQATPVTLPQSQPMYSPYAADLAVQELVMRMMQGDREAAKLQRVKFSDDRHRESIGFATGAEAKDGLLPGEAIQTASTANAE